MWCKNCNKETNNNICELCGNETDNDYPVEVYWCENCKIPIIRNTNDIDKQFCTLCKSKTKYMSTDLRPVFPEERLLIELLIAQPFEFINSSVWASRNRYYIDGKVKSISSKLYREVDTKKLIQSLNDYKEKNSYDNFLNSINTFIKANSTRLNYLYDEACQFVNNTVVDFERENVVISFSGGKDSTVVADLVVRALSDPSIVHIFGDTTLEFSLTLDYVKRFRENNPKAIFKTAKNKDQDFFEVCKDIGPPARMLRWCCTMFKTGPITRVINNVYRDTNILTFYGIRKSESVSRSKYNRVEDNSEAIKIQKQKVASPIFYWRDIDIWLYILGKEVDFNDAYRLGYDRVGCWCCPNNNERAQFLSSIYMTNEMNNWNGFLIDFAKSIGKPDPEVYVESGKWKARQGGNGLSSSKDVKIKFTNCTNEDYAKIYSLNREVDKMFYDLFIPFGRVAPELGRKLINEVIILDKRNNVPILSIQPQNNDEYDYSVKIKTLNVEKHDDLQRMVSYQIKKFNACRNCLKCESVCPKGAITISNGDYRIDENKCIQCKKCINTKYISGGCLMEKVLRTKSKND